jgi:ATP-dependent Zn protease
MSKEEAIELVSRAYQAACELTDSNIDAVKKIAFELMTKGRIEGHTIKQIIDTTAK